MAYLPAFADGAQWHGVPHHCHQGLCSCDGCVEQLDIGQEPIIHKVFHGCVTAAGVTGTHRGQKHGTELLAWFKENEQIQPYDEWSDDLFIFIVKQLSNQMINKYWVKYNQQQGVQRTTTPISL